MELKDYIRVIRRRLGWFITVMTVVLGGYLAVATVTEKRIFFARVELYVISTRTTSLLEGVRDYFPDTGKMSAETRIETIKGPDVAELAALYLCDAKAGPGGDYFFAAERKAADAARESLRSDVMKLYREEHPGKSDADLLAAFGAEIDRAVDGLRILDPKTGQWKGTRGKWQERYVKGIAAAIDRRYGVEKPDKTQIIKITVQADHPGKAVAVANALCDAAICYNRDLDNRHLDAARISGKRKIEEHQLKLGECRQQLKQFWKEHGLTQSAQGAYETSAQFYQLIAALQTDLDRLQGELLKKDEEQAKIEEKRRLAREQFPEFSLPKDSILSQLLAQRSAEEKNLEGLLSRYTDQHPDVKRSRNALEELKQQYAEALRKFQENDLRSYQWDKAVVELEKTFLRREIERKRERLAGLEVQRVNVDQLRIDEMELSNLIKHLEGEVERLSNFISMAELYAESAAKPVERFRSAPLDPKTDWWEESTDVLQMMWFMFVVAFLLSVGVVFLVEYMDTTLKTEHDIRRHLNLPVLGIIHHQREGESVLLTELPTKDAFAEKFYTAATIIKSASQDLGLKTFIVSSTVPKEGKTTITVNLGVALARKGLKVIVVDSDLRIPQIHEILGLDNAYGLSSVLEGRLKAKEILSDITAPGAPKQGGLLSFLQDTTVENLRILTSGPIPPDPVALLESVRMKALFEELKGLADFVLFDTPPLTNVGDTLTLAAMADANIFVVGAGSVEQHQVTWAKHLLSNVEANVLGCFLNHATIEGRSYYYYYNEYKSYRARG